MQRGGAAASGHPNAELLTMMEDAVVQDGIGTEIFESEAALSGLCTRLQEVRCVLVGLLTVVQV